MKIGDVLHRTSIQAVEIEIDTEFEEICKTYLEQHGCGMRQTKPGWWLVSFPEGTIEEERLGTSGLYTRRSYIVLPSQVEMPLYRASPVNEMQYTRVSMGFPPEIFPS